MKENNTWIDVLDTTIPREASWISENPLPTEMTDGVLFSEVTNALMLFKEWAEEYEISPILFTLKEIMLTERKKRERKYI